MGGYAFNHPQFLSEKKRGHLLGGERTGRPGQFQSDAKVQGGDIERDHQRGHCSPLLSKEKKERAPSLPHFAEKSGGLNVGTTPDLEGGRTGRKRFPS